MRSSSLWCAALVDKVLNYRRRMFLFVFSHADVHAKATLESEPTPVCRMKVHLGLVVTAAGVCGTLSFVFLATSLGTDYWYIIEVNPAMNMSDLNSHSGLWSIHEGGKTHTGYIDSFTANYSGYSEAELHMLGMHRTIVVLLPLSLVLLLIGGICGLVSSLAQSQVLLTGTASYFFICSLLTLSGVSLYINYSYRALAETEKLEGKEGLACIHTSFGWSLALAWLSYGLELLTGVLLLVAARLTKLQHVSVAYKPEKSPRQAEDGNC